MFALVSKTEHQAYKPAIKSNGSTSVPFFQAKLTVNQPGDRYEQEADQIADQVTRMREGDAPIVQRMPLRPLSSVQRACTACEEKEEVQRKETGEAADYSAPSIVSDVFSSGSGQPLDSSSRQFMESRMGQDFSQVRVHVGSRAAESAQAIQARAYTSRNNLVFGAGEYQPGSDEGKRLLAHELVHVGQQRNAGSGIQRQVAPVAPSTQSVITTAPDSSFGVENIPAGGSTVNRMGIVNRDSSPQARLRSTPSTDSMNNVLEELPFNTHVYVIKSFPGNWYFVTTADGAMGYIANTYVWTNLPEPRAQLHRVTAGRPGYAISIAERYFGSIADNWGQDLRFYVNVLAAVNHLSVPDTVSGWRTVAFQADSFIWIPTVEFTRAMRGRVNSGSLSYEVASALGVAGIIESIGQKLEDFATAIRLSGQYMQEEITRRSLQALQQVLSGLIDMILLSGAIIAVSTAVGALVGAVFGGGVGAAPGAAAGFEIGVALVQWMGLGFLIAWIATTITSLASAFARFIGTVWNADGNTRQLNIAARQFAEAIGRLIAAILEGLILWATSRGLPSLLRRMGNTRWGRALGGTQFGRWIRERMTNLETGRSPLPPPTLGNRRGDFRDLDHGRVSELLLRIPRNARMRVLRPIEGAVQEGVEYTWVQNGQTWRVRIHGPDASAPVLSNARNNWVFRVERSGRVMSPDGVFHQSGVTNPKSPFYNEQLANDTHIIIDPDVNPAGLPIATNPALVPVPDDSEDN